MVRDGAQRSDADLVAAARAGDKEAFAALAERHRGMVLALVRRILDSPDLAADAVSEATVAALVGLARLRCPERFGAWYAGIALNVARRWMRELATRAPLPADVADGAEDADAAPGPEERAEAAELAGRIRQAVATLAPGQREAVLAFYWQGLTHAQAAAELGISPGAVKARLHQARAALAPRLTRYVEIEREAAPMTAAAELDWVDMSVTEIRRAAGDDPTRRSHVVVLQERGGSRRLPIWTGPTEATALACALEAVEAPRPLTYQLAVNLLGVAGASVAEVRITRLAESVFYAVVLLAGRAGQVAVDARPSDALNLALVEGCPIRVDPALLDDPAAAGRTDWQPYPTGAAELAEEVRQRQAETRAAIAAGKDPLP